MYKPPTDVPQPGMVLKRYTWSGSPSGKLSWVIVLLFMEPSFTGRGCVEGCDPDQTMLILARRLCFRLLRLRNVLPDALDDPLHARGVV